MQGDHALSRDGSVAGQPSVRRMMGRLSEGQGRKGAGGGEGLEASCGTWTRVLTSLRCSLLGPNQRELLAEWRCEAEVKGHHYG